jgi:hypothetical protein
MCDKPGNPVEDRAILTRNVRDRLTTEDPPSYTSGVNETKDAEQPYNQGKQVETSDQEQRRLTRLLSASIQEREMQLRVLNSLLKNLEIRQKEAYYLLESVNDSSCIQRDQIKEMQKHITSSW